MGFHVFRVRQPPPQSREEKRGEEKREERKEGERRRKREARDLEAQLFVAGGSPTAAQRDRVPVAWLPNKLSYQMKQERKQKKTVHSQN